MMSSLVREVFFFKGGFAGDFVGRRGALFFVGICLMGLFLILILRRIRSAELWERGEVDLEGVGFFRLRS